MTDNEIIKAFECCEANEGNRPNCKECPWFRLEEKPVDCHKQVRKNAIDLINRQKEEIERLQKENEILSVNADNAFQEGLNENRELFKQEVEKDIKAEAVREFTEEINMMITEIYNKHIFGSNDLVAEEKDAIINFSDDVTSGLENLIRKWLGDTNGEI